MPEPFDLERLRIPDDSAYRELLERCPGVALRRYADAIAASDKFLFVWAPNSDKEILVYGVDGKYVTQFELSRSGFGFSLSWANDMLWIAEDADGSSDGADGTWYGYELKGLE